VVSGKEEKREKERGEKAGQTADILDTDSGKLRKIEGGVVSVKKKSVQNREKGGGWALITAYQATATVV